jgi:hypothetical protein
MWWVFNPLNAELNPICHMLALLEAHPILHVSTVKVKRGGNFMLEESHLPVCGAASLGEW